MHSWNYFVTQNNDKAFLDSWQKLCAKIWERCWNFTFSEWSFNGLVGNICDIKRCDFKFLITLCDNIWWSRIKKLKPKTRRPNFANVSNERTTRRNDACAIGSYVFEITWFETMRSGHMAIMRNPYRLPYPKSAFIKLDKGVKCLIKSALKCVFAALTKNQLLV